MKNVEAVKGERLVPPIDSLAIIGRGQIGTLFAERLIPLAGLSVYAGGRAEIAEVMEQQPEVVIAATPNPVGEVVAEIAARAQATFALVLPQNGVGIIEQAQEAVRRSDIPLIRASLFTMVSQGEGGIRYDPTKLRIALAPGRLHDRWDLSRVRMAFVSAGFAVESYDNPHDMEWTKLLANSLGTTSSVTGLTPRETFADDALFSLELRGLRERIAIIKAGGIKLLNIPWAKTPLMRLGAMALPAHPPEAIKRMIGETIAEGRRNLPSAATRRIMEGKDPSEALRYHLPFIQLASQTGLTASIDAAIADIVGQHLRGEINLREMTSPQKIELLLARLH